MLNELLLVLTEFGDGPAGSPANAAVRFLLPAGAWIALAIVAAHQWRENVEKRDRLLAVAAVIGAVRELFMFVAEYGGYRGHVSYELLFRYYPPFEHAATMASIIVAAYAFMVYFVGPSCRSGRYLIVGLSATTLLYAVTGPLWIRYLAEVSAATGTLPLFGSFWGDMAFRVTAVLIFSWHMAVFLAARRRGRRLPGILMTAFSLFFLDEVLMIVNLLQHEAHIAFFAPVRHNLHIGGVVLLGGVYWLDLRQRMLASEKQLQQAHATLERQYVELQKVDRIKDNLLYDVSHELQTPVAKMAMSIELLHEQLERPEPSMLRSIVASMDATIRRQDGVIRNILELARLEKGDRRPASGPVNLEGLLADLLREYDEHFKALGAVVVTRLSPVKVLTDRDLLWHVLSNAMNNALKYRSPQRSVVLTITLARVGEQAVIAIADNGIGMDPGEVGRAFEGFFQASPSTEGAGIGLTIAHRIVSDLGGAIDIRSDGPDRGTTVTVSLPIDGAVG